MLKPIDIIEPETKYYRENENTELLKIVNNLYNDDFIDNQQFDINMSEIETGAILSPISKSTDIKDQQRLLKQFSEIVGNTKTTTKSLTRDNTLIVKYESDNPFGSHGDRVFAGILPELLQRNPLEKVIEISSGSIGISIAGIVGYILGQQIQLITANNSYPIRYSLAQRLGAYITLTEKSTGISGASEILQSEIRSLVRNGYKFPNHSDKHWGVIEPQMKNIVSEVQHKINYFMAIKGNGTTALGITNGVLERNPEATILGARYSHKESGKPILIPGADEVTIDFPRLDAFEKFEQQELRIPLEHIHKYANNHQLGYSSALARLAVDKYLNQNPHIQGQNFLVIDYDSYKRY